MSTYRKPNLNGPRYRRPTHGTHNKAMYELLRQKVPAVASLTDKQLQDVLLELSFLLAETVVDTREGIELPEQFGHLFIGSCAHPKRGIIDHKASAELGQRVSFRNWNTDGYIAKIFYSTVASRYRFKHHELWGFEACRNFKRYMGKIYPVQFERYLRVDPDRKTKSTYTSTLHKLEAKEVRQASLTTYNELSFD